MQIECGSLCAHAPTSHSAFPHATHARAEDRIMLFKVLCATLLISSGEALKVSAGVSRRAAIAKAASVALPFVIAPAFAEEDRKLKRAGDSDIYARADAGTLMADRAIKRAQAGDLADGSSATVMDATTQTELAAVFPGHIWGG